LPYSNDNKCKNRKHKATKEIDAEITGLVDCKAERVGPG